MKVLLDTHTFLWWITDSPRLSARAREVIRDSNNELFFSAASGWEIAVKARLGRLQLPDNLEQFIVE
jgi:PIN domain nuclease of toxin-antitoxin system